MNSSQMGKLSWKKRKSPEEYLRLKEISKLGVEARKKRHEKTNI